MADIELIVFDGYVNMVDTATKIIGAVRAHKLCLVFALALGESRRDGSIHILRGRQLVTERLGYGHTLEPVAAQIDGHGDAPDVNRTAL